MIHSESRLSQQISFILEIDKLKSILRRSYLINEERHENSAEHSWHVCMLAIVLSEYANVKIDVLRAIKILLIHDIVEIDAGDTYIYNTDAKILQHEIESKAADRIFGMLPPEQCTEFRSLWNEYEARQTPEARFAYAVDRLMPLLHNFNTNGRAWIEHGIHVQQVLDINKAIGNGSDELWKFAEKIIKEAVDKGYLIDQ